MPHRFAPFIAALEIKIAAFCTMLASIGGIDDLTSPAIWDKTQFRLVCFLGAMGGAFLAISIFPPRPNVGNYARRMALKFASSAVAGLMFTPIIIRWQAWPVDVDVVLAVSGVVALLSVSLISGLVPIAIKKVLGKASDPEP